tara:strand:+ start:1322 stop:2107 length:786 start_codon:yes stop_codon:yes gene_type:complete
MLFYVNKNSAQLQNKVCLIFFLWQTDLIMFKKLILTLFIFITSVAYSDETKGKSVIIYAGGEKYEAEWDGLPNGQGTFTHSNGSRYTGEWTNGTFDGQKVFFPDGEGTIFFPDGNQYTGNLYCGFPDYQIDASNAAQSYREGFLSFPASKERLDELIVEQAEELRNCDYYKPEYIEELALERWKLDFFKEERIKKNSMDENWEILSFTDFEKMYGYCAYNFYSQRQHILNMVRDIKNYDGSSELRRIKKTYRECENLRSGR